MRLRKTQHNRFSKKIEDTCTPQLRAEATFSTDISDAYSKMPGKRNTHSPPLGKGSPNTLHTGWRFTLLCGSSSHQGGLAAPSQHQCCVGTPQQLHTQGCACSRGVTALSRRRAGSWLLLQDSLPTCREIKKSKKPDEFSHKVLLKTPKSISP